MDREAGAKPRASAGARFDHREREHVGRLVHLPVGAVEHVISSSPTTRNRELDAPHPQVTEHLFGAAAEHGGRRVPGDVVIVLYLVQLGVAPISAGCTRQCCTASRTSHRWPTIV